MPVHGQKDEKRKAEESVTDANPDEGSLHIDRLPEVDAEEQISRNTEGGMLVRGKEEKRKTEESVTGANPDEDSLHIDRLVGLKARIRKNSTCRSDVPRLQLPYGHSQGAGP
jgi:hypothetical protein